MKELTCADILFGIVIAFLVLFIFLALGLPD